ncbi:MAG: Peptide transporter [Rhodocyclales bacterium]|nr:Peptide transporter [Rhodocyclales bacterium]
MKFQSTARGIMIAAFAVSVMCAPLAQAATQNWTQAPMLDPLVKAGKLPPLAQRLPQKPEVITPIERKGIYGGTLRTAMRSSNDQNSILRISGVEGLVRWDMDFNKAIPNLAESWTISPDASEFVFKLRKGARWSDGSPFTADDILFAMNDLIYNKTFFNLTPSGYVNKDLPAKVTKIDDYTVSFKFSGPYLSFIEQLAIPYGQYATLYQKKFCSQFHPAYNPKLNELMAKENVKDWPTLMRNHCGDIEIPARFANVDRPVMDPWVIVEPYRGNATRVVLERNPYFWQVDNAGQQLPYLDRVQFQVISDVETIVLAAINGQLDYQHRHIFGIQNRPVISENAAKGGYKVMALSGTGANSAGLWLNQSTKNAKLRNLLRNKDFRVALSLSIDRKEVNDIVYLGQGMLWQIGPLKKSKWYNERLGTQFLNLDVAKANQLFDKLGLTKRDADGFRLYPEGGRVSLNTIVSVAQSQQIDTLELIRKQWAQVGIEMVVQASERTLFYDRATRNDYDISVDIIPGGMDITFNPRAILAIHPLESRMSLPWTQWYLSNGKQGEEPPASMKKRMDLYDKWQSARTVAEADALFKEMLNIAADEFEVIGVIRSPSDTAIRSLRLHNVYEQMLVSFTYPNPSPALPQEWFLTPK